VRIKRKRALAQRAKKAGRGSREEPVGVAIGAAGGAAAGAAVGALAGPVGAAVGAAVGGLAGGLAGKAALVDAAAEDAYWREHYSTAPYVETGRDYTYYQPAYRYGWESYSRYGRRSFDEIDEQLMREWDTRRGQSLQTWREARDAARDAWTRVASSNAASTGRGRNPSSPRGRATEAPARARSSQDRRLPKKGRRVPSGSR
jgi:hypothetical protein